MKKILSFLLILSFLILSVSAVIPGEDAAPSDVSAAELAIRDYFYQRELLLTNKADTIPITLFGITEDELKHRSQLAESNIAFTESLTLESLWE